MQIAFSAARRIGCEDAQLWLFGAYVLDGLLQACFLGGEALGLAIDEQEDDGGVGLAWAP